jgi:eukaryotic-like serine/threonine-protein kinase
MSTTPNVLIDRYEVGRLLGSGGMAEVFEGRDRLLARRVAIKVLLSQYARDPAFLTRFKREAQAAASLSHPNIVGVYDTGVQDGTNFIVMEYVEGRTLREVIRNEGPLMPERAAEIASDVCQALAAAHARGLIHRDIKPGNVMLTPDGTVKVMDFGIARATTSETITQTSAVIGTAQYISPEQAQGQTVDFRSDLYSLGCCLYEMLTGVVPFTGATPVAIAYRHVREDPTPPRQLNPDVTPELEAVVLKAMAKHPDERYQTAVEMRQDLDRVLAGQDVLAGVPGEAPTVALGGVPVGQDAQQTAMLGAAGTMQQPSVGAGSGYPYGGAYPLPGERRVSVGWVVLVLLGLALAGALGYFGAKALLNNDTGNPPATTAPPVTSAPTTSQQQTSSSAQQTTTSKRETTTTERSTTTTSTTTTTTTQPTSTSASASPSTGVTVTTLSG